MWLLSVDVSCCFRNPFEKYCSNTLQSIEAQMKCDTTDLAFPLSSHHIWSVNSCQIEALKCCEIKNRSSKLQDTTYILIFLHFCTKRSKKMSCISRWHICRLTKDGQVPWRRRSTSSSLWWWPNVTQRWQQHKHSQWQSTDLDEQQEELHVHLWARPEEELFVRWLLRKRGLCSKFALKETFHLEPRRARAERVQEE